MLFDIAVLIYILVLTVAWAMLFEKAGERGWKALIPFYNLYILFKIADASRITLQTIGAGVISLCALIVSASAMYTNPLVSNVGFAISVLALIAFAFFYILAMISLCDLAGVKKPFAAGLLLLPPVFFGILAFNENIRMGADIYEI